jgi:flagellar basal-body rod modification protein FlgD
MNADRASAVPAALAAYTKPRAAEKSGDETGDRFLALLVSQLRNQDPLNPLQNSEITSQLAQINTVKGLDKLADLMQTMLGRTEANEAVQAATLVGRRVLVGGDTLALAATGDAEAGFQLDQAVDKLRVDVRDSAGALLYSADLGAKPAGLHTFAWDGLTATGVRAAEGTYKFEIEATAAGKAVQASALALGRVDGVVPGTEGATLRVGGLPPVAVADVKQIL